MQEHETHYILTKDEMLKLSTFQGDAIWRLRRSEILNMGVQPVTLMLVWAMAFLVSIRSSLFAVYIYWALLAAAGVFYVFARSMWIKNKRSACQEYAQREMLLGMEEARVKHEINCLTREIEHGSDFLGG